MTVEEIAKLISGEPAGDTQAEITGIAGIERAGPSDLTFAEGNRAIEAAARSQAGCILIPRGTAVPGRTVIAVGHPKLALVRAAAVLLPVIVAEPGIHSTALIDPTGARRLQSSRLAVLRALAAPPAGRHLKSPARFS